MRRDRSTTITLNFGNLCLILNADGREFDRIKAQLRAPCTSMVRQHSANLVNSIQLLAGPRCQIDGNFRMQLPIIMRWGASAFRLLSGRHSTPSQHPPIRLTC
jgi:hypothetical protein